MSLTRYDCALDGVPLREVSDAICITDISEQEPEEELTVIPWTVRMGSSRVRRKRNSLTVVISFVITAQDVPKRKAVCQAAQAWARSGASLTINDRPGQRLSVVCEELPRLLSAQNWQHVIQMQFTAYALPYWEDTDATAVTTSNSATMFVPGNAENTLANVRVVNNGSSAVTAVTVTAGGSKMTFSGISLPVGAALEIGHTEDGLLYARIGETSVLSKRTADSSDDLLVPCGENFPVSVSTGSATFRARGLYE